MSEESEDEVNIGDEDNEINNVVHQLNRLSVAEDFNLLHENSAQEKLVTTVRLKPKIYVPYKLGEIFFKKLGFTPSKAEQSLQDMELQKKKYKKITACRKSI